MSTTVMPGLTPANARTSAGFSRVSRSRSLSVRSGLAMAVSIGVAATAIMGAVRQSRALTSIVFMRFSLRALCESRELLWNFVHRAGYSFWRTTGQFSGASMRNSSRFTILALLLSTACTAFGAGSGDMATPSDANIKGKSPELLAHQAFSAGVRAIEKADKLLAEESRVTDEAKKKKAHAKTSEAYTAAA